MTRQTLVIVGVFLTACGPVADGPSNWGGKADGDEPVPPGEWSMCRMAGVACSTGSACVGDINSWKYDLRCEGPMTPDLSECDLGRDAGSMFRQCTPEGSNCGGGAPGWQFCGYPKGTVGLVPRWQRCEAIRANDQTYIATVMFKTTVDAMFSCVAPTPPNSNCAQNGTCAPATPDPAPVTPDPAPVTPDPSPATTKWSLCNAVGIDCSTGSTCVGDVSVWKYNLKCEGPMTPALSECEIGRDNGNTFRQCTPEGSNCGGGAAGWQFCGYPKGLVGTVPRWQKCEAISANDQTYIATVMFKTTVDALFSCVAN